MLTGNTGPVTFLEQVPCGVENLPIASLMQLKFLFLCLTSNKQMNFRPHDTRAKLIRLFTSKQSPAFFLPYPLGLFQTIDSKVCIISSVHPCASARDKQNWNTLTEVTLLEAENHLKGSEPVISPVHCKTQSTLDLQRDH